MSRIEKTESKIEQEKMMRDEVIQEVKHRTKKSHPRMTCAGIVLIVLLCIASWMLWIIASTGLYTIPVFSLFAFHGPTPSRVIVPGTPVETLAENTFKSVLAQRLIRDGGKLTDRTISLEIPEASLTASMQKMIQGSSTPFLQVSGSQVVVLPNDQFEIFLPLANGANVTAVVADVTVMANHGVLSLVLKDVHVGLFHAPNWLVANVIQSTVNAELTSLNQSLGSYMEVDSLASKEGSVTLSGIFTVQVK